MYEISDSVTECQPRPYAQPTDAIASPYLFGLVQAVDKNGIKVEINGRELLAEHAVSCLIHPLVGDQVLLVKAGDTHFITEILRRTHNQTIELRFGNDLNIAVDNGEITLSAKNAINFDTQKISLVARKIFCQAGELITKYQTIRCAIGRAICSAQQFCVSVDRMLQTMKSSVRTVEGVDDTTCGDRIVNVRKTSIHRASNMINSATGEIKIDAKTINMG